MLFRNPCTNVKPLDQCHLDLRLLSQYGGEADIQFVVSSHSGAGVRVASGLDFR
jgi:hypothetical protein